MKTQNARWIQWVIAIAGAFYTFVGLTQLFAPVWFFTTIGPYPPFNRHYLGDLGAFTLPMGIALLIAARNPIQHRLFIGFVAGGSLIHSFNHLYDDLAGAAPDPVGTAVLVVFALVLIWVYFARSSSAAAQVA
ncbi:MAG: hypothetical protein DCC55_04460 [Chloroflexi bacterium]|nr:MAG: hypothetical protein DCC55_04460 [Chloroflexota bacterium]